jgi:hypothetical protein
VPIYRPGKSDGPSKNTSTAALLDGNTSTIDLLDGNTSTTDLLEENTTTAMPADKDATYLEEDVLFVPQD